MSTGLDVIIVDDDPAVCEIVAHILTRFYTWGAVRPFTTADRAIAYCLKQQPGVAIFVVDVLMGTATGFDLLDAISGTFPMAHEDTIIITGSASDEIVRTCLALDITYLIEKPIRPYTLQMAVQSIVGKYTKFAKKLLTDPNLAATLNSI
jgi:DNA-binding NarL/FixJ family response regulator